MKLSSYTSVAIPLVSSVVAASLSTFPRAACWTGQIHSACSGAKTGCTPDGLLVECQESADAMIYSSMCGCCEDAKGTCTYDADCNASCGA
ncbi:hypothetical protein F5X99DRAFT_396309 [Biscogniauxia marginata]|nr:hypothetical protein F5X99DRAFT_396309 [Biscogniauxia marginata]